MNETETLAQKLAEAIRSVFGRPGKSHHTTAIIVAGGSSSRMGDGISKQMLKLHGVPVIVHTLLAFERASSVDDILVAAKKEMPGMSAGGQQIRKTCLLSGGEKLGVGGDAPVPGQLQLVQSTGKQDPFLAVPGAFVQKFGFGHGFTPYLA